MSKAVYQRDLVHGPAVNIDWVVLLGGQQLPNLQQRGIETRRRLVSSRCPAGPRAPGRCRLTDIATASNVDSPAQVDARGWVASSLLPFLGVSVWTDDSR